MMKKLLLRTGIALGLIVLLLFCAAGAHSLIAQQKLKSVCAQLRQDSIPLSWEEYYTLFPNVEAHLAAQPQFFAALDSLYNHPSRFKLKGEKKIIISPRLPELKDTATADEIAALDDYLSHMAPAIAAVREAVAAEPFWFVEPKNWGDFYSAPRFLQLREPAAQFHRTAILHAERNEPHAAMQAVINGLRLAEVPHRGSFGIDEILRFGLEGTALRSLEYVLAKTDPAQGSIHDLKKYMVKHSDMRSAILSEIVRRKQISDYTSGLTLKEIQTILEHCDSPFWQLVIWRSQTYSGWSRIDDAYALELLHRVVNIWDLNWQDFNQNYMRACESIPWFYSSVAWLDSSPMIKHLELRSTGAWNCGRIAIAIEMYTQKHGKLPATLADLVPEYLDTIPTEPFYGKPLEYETDGGSGTLSFSYPDSGKEAWQKGKTHTFKVFANRRSIKREG